jgi:NLI interacting factor-like phosphatase
VTFSEYLDIARQLHLIYKLFQDKESRKMTYRCRLLEEFAICAYFQSLAKEKYSFVSAFKQIASYIYKNFVILLDLIMERAGTVYSTQCNFDKLKTLLSKRKAYFDISSNFSIDKRLKLMASNFASIEAIAKGGSQIKNKSCPIGPLLLQVISIVMSDMKSTDKELTLSALYDLIEINYESICTSESTAAVGKGCPSSVFGDGKPADHVEVKTESSLKTSVARRDKTEDKKVTFKLDYEVDRRSACLLPPISSKFKYTIVLDLDETLVHFVDKQQREAQFLLRPYAREFIKTFGSMFELIIFTAAIKEVVQHIIVSMQIGY